MVEEDGSRGRTLGRQEEGGGEALNTHRSGLVVFKASPNGTPRLPDGTENNGRATDRPNQTL